jgi:hypothetical protein
MIIPAVLFMGIFLALIAIRGTHNDFFELVKGDFTGPNNFIPWFASLAFLWFLGFIPGFRPVSRGLILLVLLVLFLKRGTGFFSQLNRQLGI